jgi:beta-ribofuranosylaminobenzene 5'-phosphate synthase
MVEHQIAITARSRLHFALIDVGYATSRLYGGVGVSILGPSARIVARAASHFSLQSAKPLDIQTRTSMQALFKRLQAIGCPGATVELQRIMPQHVGLGSKTAILSATAEAVALVTGAHFSRLELQRLTGRGGTSGIGMHAYFLGGLITDSGHRRSRVSVTFVPSSARVPTALPAMTSRTLAPQRWRVHLLLPKSHRTSGAQERAFFAANAPVPALQVLKVMSNVFHGIVPAFATTDYRLLRESLASLQRLGFKKREIAAHGPVVSSLIHDVEGLGLAVGMSSMGPLTYVITDDEVHRNAIDGLTRVAVAHQAEVISNLRMSNSGRSVQMW